MVGQGVDRVRIALEERRVSRDSRSERQSTGRNIVIVPKLVLQILINLVRLQ